MVTAPFFTQTHSWRKWLWDRCATSGSTNNNLKCYRKRFTNSKNLFSFFLFGLFGCFFFHVSFPVRSFSMAGDGTPLLFVVYWINWCCCRNFYFAIFFIILLRSWLWFHSSSTSTLNLCWALHKSTDRTLVEYWMSRPIYCTPFNSRNLIIYQVYCYSRWVSFKIGTKWLVSHQLCLIWFCGLQSVWNASTIPSFGFWVVSFGGAVTQAFNKIPTTSHRIWNEWKVLVFRSLIINESKSWLMDFVAFVKFFETNMSKLLNRKLLNK